MTWIASLRRHPQHQSPEPTNPTEVLDGRRMDAVLFDLDGVLTDTASLHLAAWTTVFEELFRRHGILDPSGRPRLFTPEDYRRLVDGEPRLDGIHHVLTEAGLALPEGKPEDRPGGATTWAMANAKDARYESLLADAGPRPYPSAVALVHQLHEAGIGVGVVSASRHCQEVLAAAALSYAVDTVVDGWSAAAMGLAGKPDPATYLEAAARMGVEPADAVVVEDALAGVRAGRGGGFGVVIGIDHGGLTRQLVDAGADIVVDDLSQVRFDLVPKGGWSFDLTAVGEGEQTAASEGCREALGTLANGYLGTRASAPWPSSDPSAHPGTYVAGLYNRLTSDVEGTAVEHESMVNVPNWMPFNFSADGGAWLGEPNVDTAIRRASVDLHRGLLVRIWQVLDESGRRSLVIERRFVSMAEPHLAAQQISVIAENWSGQLRVRCQLDGDVANDQTEEGKLLAHRHLQAIEVGHDGPVSWLSARTTQSDAKVVEAARISVTVGSVEARQYFTGPSSTGQELTVTIAENGRATVERIVAVYTSRDRAISEPRIAAVTAVESAGSFDTLLRDHHGSWSRLWDRSRFVADIVQADVPDNQQAPIGSKAATRPDQAVRLDLFHLFQVASPHVADLDVGVPARGLAGEGYLGHVFWDELFVFPALNFRFPETARALLRYRARRLGAARRAASAAGHGGAMFPWQSGSDGRDETPPMLYNPRDERWVPDRSSRQHHVGLAIAYELWQHRQTTGDSGFFFEEGAEMLLEIARFFASLATLDQGTGRWHIRGVMGPDEFHDRYPGTAGGGIDDNAYTNIMTAWLLGRAQELVTLLRWDHRSDVLERLRLGQEEVDRWDKLATGLYVPFHDGVISQFESYEQLAPVDLGAYRARYGDIGRLDLILEAEGDEVCRYQVAKQADVLMLLYLLSAEELRDVLAGLGYELPAATVRRTVDYYATRVAHGSSLSAVVHAWVTARADRAGSWEQFRRALAIDISQTESGATAEGIHLGAMAGTIDLLQRCYAGLEVRNDALWLNPVLPDEVERLRFGITYRGHWVDLDIDHDRVVVAAANAHAGPSNVVIAGRFHVLEAGRRLQQGL